MWSLHAVAKAHDRSESRKLVTGNFKWTVITSKVNPWATLVTIFYIRPKLSLLTLIEIDIWNPTSTNMNSSLSKISQYCHNFIKSLISGLRQYLIWSGWTELAPSDPRKVGSHLSLGEQVGGVWVGQNVSLELAIHTFRIRMYRIKYPKNSNEANGCDFGKHGIFGFSMRLSVFLSWVPVVSDHGGIKSIFLLGRAPHLDKVMDFLLKVQRSFKFCIQIWQIKTFFVYYCLMRYSQIHLHSTDYTVNSMHSACLHVYINGGPNISCFLFLCFTCFCHNYVWDAIYACHACTYWNWR